MGETRIGRVRTLLGQANPWSLEAEKGTTMNTNFHSSRVSARPSPLFTKPTWYVCVEDGAPVGPVSADQIARGILAGKVPRDAYVARAGDGGWREILDTREIVAALKAL